MLWSGGTAIALLIVVFLATLLSDGLHEVVELVFLVAFACVPAGVLAGLLRTRLARAGVADLVVRLGAGVGPGQLRDVLADVLGDPSLDVAYWVPEQQRYVDVEGRPVALPEPGAVTVVEREGRPVAALVHDPSVGEDDGLVEAVGAAAGLALENERLQAELRARVAELAGSRARLVQAADDERRRIERNLHDGTQQRLVSVSMALGLAQAKLPADAAARAIVAEPRPRLAMRSRSCVRSATASTPRC